MKNPKQVIGSCKCDVIQRTEIVQLLENAEEPLTYTLARDVIKSS
jgi:hypothetical protein